MRKVASTFKRSTEDWLLFPMGVATDVSAMFCSLSGALSWNAGLLHRWCGPNLEGSSAGVPCDFDQRVLLAYSVTEPNENAWLKRLRVTTWYLSGRVRCETVLVDSERNEVSRKLRWQAYDEAMRALTTVESLVKSGFFFDYSGEVGDGYHDFLCYHRGTRLEKRLSYEVEMGIRCGLTLAENQAIDLLTMLEDQAGQVDPR